VTKIINEIMEMKCLVGSGNSVEISMLTLEGESWRQGMLDDSGRAEIPLSKVNLEFFILQSCN